MKVCVIIPCRYDSVRFPGKPLRILNGKPLLYYPYVAAKKVKSIKGVYIATDDDRIVNACKEFGFNFILTSNKHPTGSDRVAEAFFKLKKFDAAINIQGDEPFVTPIQIQKCFNILKKKNVQAANAISPIYNTSDILNYGVVKVEINEKKIIAVSRYPIPYTQNKFTKFNYYRAVGIYGFKKKALKTYLNNKQKYLEKAESVEIIRILENNLDVNYFNVNIKGPAVDTKNDLDNAERIMKK